jgi:hypothetical protein
MSNNNSHVAIYQQIIKGENVNTFEQWMWNKLQGQKFNKLNQSYFKVRDLLIRDFKKGDWPDCIRWPVKKHFRWLWEHGKIEVESSVCTPHSRRLGNYILYYDGTLRNVKTQNIIINPTLNEEGYATFGGKLIHRLMAEAWLKNPDIDEYTEVNHKDKNRSNNNIENLEWVDHKNNMLHKNGKSYDAAPRYYTECKVGI